MEEDLIVDKQYLKGFNQGYILAEHTPDLIQKLLKNDLPANEYFIGFKAGKQELEREKVRDRLKGLNRNDTLAKEPKRKNREK